MLHNKDQTIKSKIHYLGHIFELKKKDHNYLFLFGFLDLYLGLVQRGGSSL